MMKLSSKNLITIIVCGALLAGALPIALGYDVSTVPTPTGKKPVLTATPAPSEVEATNEATELPYENPYADIPFSRTEDGAPVLGNPDAPITIIEFADFACPYCQRYEPTMQAFIQKYVATGRAKYEFRILPTAGGQMTSFIGSMVSCMEDQDAGVFWPLHDELYARAELGEYDGDVMKEVAKQFHLNYADALTCMGQQGKPLQAETDTQLASKLAVTGTPGIRVRYKGHNDEKAQYLVVDGQLHDKGGPPLNVLEQAVEDAEAGHIPDAEITPDAPMLPSIPV
jgi:protein-disulfide isomerase